MPEPIQAATTPPAAETTPPTPSPAPAPAPQPAAPKPAGRRVPLADQYAFDSAFDASQDNPVENTPVPAPAAAPAPPAPAAVPAPPASRHKPRLVAFARDLGLADATIEAMTPEALEEAALDFGSRQIQLTRQLRREELVQGVLDPRPAAPSGNGFSGQPAYNPAAPGTPPATPLPAAPAPPAADEYDLGIDTSLFDPSLIQAIKNVGLRAQKRIAELESQVGAVNQRENLREQLTMAQRLDRYFAAKKELYGEAPGRTLQPSDPLMLRRMAVISLADRDASHRSLEEKLASAHQAIFGAAAPPPPAPPPGTPPAPDPQQQLRDEWTQAGLARPTHRGNAPEAKGTEKAVATVTRILKEAGVGDEADDPNAFPS